MQKAKWWLRTWDAGEDRTTNDERWTAVQCALSYTTMAKQIHELIFFSVFGSSIFHSHHTPFGRRLTLKTETTPSMLCNNTRNASHLRSCRPYEATHCTSHQIFFSHFIFPTICSGYFSVSPAHRSRILALPLVLRAAAASPRFWLGFIATVVAASFSSVPLLHFPPNKFELKF